MASTLQRRKWRLREARSPVPAGCSQKPRTRMPAASCRVVSGPGGSPEGPIQMFLIALQQSTGKSLTKAFGLAVLSFQNPGWL